MSNQPVHNRERRTFLKAAAGGVLILKPETVFGSQANSTVEAGLVGCGGRGNWIAPFFAAHADARIVAVADVVKTRLDSTRQKLRVDSSRAYHGPDAYKELAGSRLDAVVIETPPYFHPMQAAAAVDAGKHVYCAKPVAVDVPSSKDFLETGKKAQSKNLSFWTDFQSRARPVFQEVTARIQRGDIGKVVLAQVLYYAGRPLKDTSTPGMDAGLKRLLHWVCDRELSGDIIVEQNIHVIDMANYYLGARLRRHALRRAGSHYQRPEGERLDGRGAGRHLHGWRYHQRQGFHREHPRGEAHQQRRRCGGEQLNGDPWPDGCLRTAHGGLG